MTVGSRCAIAESMIRCFKCHRHIRESACPFCGTVNQASVAMPGPRASRVGIARCAIIVGVIASTAATTSCGPGGGADANTTDDVIHDVLTAGDVHVISPDASADVQSTPSDVPMDIPQDV